MSKIIEQKTENQNDSLWWEILQDCGLAVIKFVAICFAIYVLARLIAIPFGYGFFIDYLSSDFGLQDVYARPFAIALTALTVAVTPTLLFAALFGYRAKQVFVWILGSSIIMATATYFFTGDVYFDRVTGKAQKCYAKTLEGFKFSSTCDFDPKLGVRFQKITSDVMKEIVFWQRNGTLKDIPSINDGQYFDPLTGESIVWYSLRPDGSMHLFSLPGFDQTTGEILKPITKKVINEYSLGDEHASSVVNNYKSKTLLADINSAFSVGSGQYGSTEGSKLAMGRIWKWYFSQGGLPNVKSSSVVIGTWSKDVTSFHVEKVFEVKPYAFVVVSFSAVDHAESVYCISSVRDKDAHDVSSIFRPELAGFRDGDGDTKRGYTVELHLNPHETVRAMYLIFNTAPGQMNAGYVQCNSEKAVEYSSVM